MPVQLSSHRDLAHLVRLAQQGDRRAFEELYRKTAQVQYFTIVGKIGEAAATDVLQEVYLTLWRNLDKVNPHAVVAYLNTIARNLCSKHLRNAHSPVAATAMPDEDLEELGGPARGEHGDNPAELVKTRDEHDRLRRALLEHLTDEERTVVLMRYYQNMKLQEVAEQTGLSLSTVKRTLSRALATLRAKMGVAFLPLGFSGTLASAVGEPAAPGAAVPPSVGERLVRYGSRAVGALAVAAAVGAVAVAVLPMPQPEEVVAPEVVPAAAPADTTPPVVAAQEVQDGVVVLTVADDSSGVGAVWCVGPDGTEYWPAEESVASDAETDTAAPAPTLRTFHFHLETGTYDLHLTDAAGNTTSGPLKVQLYPEP